MADPSTVLAVAPTSWVFVVIPGPSVPFVVGRGVALGRRAALLSVLATRQAVTGRDG